MRTATLFTAIAAALSLGACTYVERTPTPAVTAPPTVTVRPGY